MPGMDDELIGWQHDKDWRNEHSEASQKVTYVPHPNWSRTQDRDAHMKGLAGIDGGKENSLRMASRARPNPSMVAESNRICPP